MQKFTKINESKRFFPDPSIVKRYAGFIIPLYISGELKCDEKLLDEWLEMNKSKEKSKFSNFISDLEIMAVKNVLENPTTPIGFNQIKSELDNKCPKLERFLRKFIQSKG